MLAALANGGGARARETVPMYVHDVFFLKSRRGFEKSSTTFVLDFFGGVMNTRENID